MPNKRYALVIRLWQVKGDRALAATSDRLDPDDALDLSESTAYYHWRGAIQLAGDTQLHYFNSLQEMNQLIARLVDATAA